jgi:hypothetical protein
MGLVVCKNVVLFLTTALAGFYEHTEHRECKEGPDSLTQHAAGDILEIIRIDVRDVQVRAANSQWQSEKCDAGPDDCTKGYRHLDINFNRVHGLNAYSRTEFYAGCLFSA